MIKDNIIKNILKTTIALSLLMFILGSCSENERALFTAKQGLYFAEYTEKDSINYTFTMTAEATDTIDVLVNLMGQPFASDMNFSLKIADGTTAKSGVHFEALEDSYVLSAGATNAVVPIILKESEDLQTVTVKLNLSIVADENFEIGFDESNLLSINITDQLVMPSYWAGDYPGGMLQMYFGDYSRVKHAKAVEIMGHDFPLTTSGFNYSYYMAQGRAVAQYFALNPTYDENGDLIEAWSPF